MQAIKCELCGSSDIMKQNGFFQCQNCGTKYSLEEARNLIGVVKIDKSDDIENLFTLARRCFEEKNYTESEKYYELVMREVPNNWVALFYQAYCHAYSTCSVNCEDALDLIFSRTRTAAKLIKENLNGQDKSDAITKIMKLNPEIIDKIVRAAVQVFSSSIYKLDALLNKTGDYFISLETLIKQDFPYQKEALTAIQRALYHHVEHYSLLDRKERKFLLNRLKAEMDH